jgi:hypothetical protein
VVELDLAAHDCWPSKGGAAKDEHRSEGTFATRTYTLWKKVAMLLLLFTIAIAVTVH